MNKFLLLALLPIGCLVGCADWKPAQTTHQTTNTAITVALLFEHDGVKVYRFMDGDRSVYYADARGKVSWTHTETSGGKTPTTKIIDHETPTVGETAPVPPRLETESPECGTFEYMRVRERCKVVPAASAYAKQRLAETGILTMDDYEHIKLLSKEYDRADQEAMKADSIKKIKEGP